MAAEIAGCCLQDGLSVRCSQGQAVGQMAENNGLILAPDLSGHWGCSDQTRYSLVSGVYQCSPEGSLIVGSACLGSILSLSPRLISIFWEVFGKCVSQVLLENAASKGLGWRPEIVCFY